MKKFLALLLASVMLVPQAGAQAAKEPPSRPNVVLIVADDLGVPDLSTYGRGRVAVPTPNLDRLAKQGVTFRRGYSTAPVCSPARAALMSGQYQQRHGFEFLTPEGADGGKQGLAPEQRVFAADLKAAGYRTGIVGKWHLGSTPDRLPTARGFDFFHGFLSGETAYADAATPGLTSLPIPYLGDRSFTRKSDWVRVMTSRAGQEGPPTVVNNDNVYLTDDLTEQAVSFIREAGDTPYFLYAAHLAPHSPMQALEADIARFKHIKEPLQRVYAAMIHSLDRSVGKILDAVKKSGKADNTIIIFTADNGAATYIGVSDCETIAGGKLSMFEGGTRVPYIVSWPARWPKASVDARNVSHLDVAPTVLAAAGATSATAFDGKDLTPLMQPGRRSEVVHETLFWRVGPEYAALSGDMKLISNTRPGSFPWLFDISKDPTERNLLTFSRRDAVGELVKRYKAWESSMKAPNWQPKQVLQVFQCGRISFHEQ
ncbi:MAG: sulfatase-like hydrolase/transferase [Alphaproteobacteria bacterium]|jgi:arylsulfatase A-like enzyme